MNESLLAEKVDHLNKQKGLDESVNSHIKDWILRSDLPSRIRINPFHICNDKFSINDIIPSLLHGVKVGLFNLHWDVHCPYCNMVTEEIDSLANLHAESSCKMCESTFNADFLDRIEVRFSLNKEIEDTKIPAFCLPPPSLKSQYNFSVQMNGVQKGEEIMEPGIYRYTCPISLAKGILTVEGERTEEVREIHLTQPPAPEFDQNEITIQPGPLKLTLTNKGFPASGLFIYPDDLKNEIPLDKLPIRLSGFGLLHFPAYLELFGETALSKKGKVDIRSLTVMFTDIAGSTAMYERLGDVKAYNNVQDHFDILIETIELNGGVIIKTIGDAVMASFVKTESAFQAAKEAASQLETYNRNKPKDEHIEIKVGIHRGSAILVNLNNNLDYFGATINKAARVQGLSKEGELTFSEELYQDKSTKDSINKLIPHEKLSQNHVEMKGIEGKHLVYSCSLKDMTKALT